MGQFIKECTPPPKDDLSEVYEWGQLIYFTHLYNVYIKSQTISYDILHRDDYVRSINRTIKKINHVPKHPFWHLRALVSVVAF